MSVESWAARWRALREMDGTAWDAEHERLSGAWEREYQAAFVAHALTRPTGWTRENAEVWAHEIVRDAMIEHGGDPGVAARADVLAAEQESAE